MADDVSDTEEDDSGTQTSVEASAHASERMETGEVNSKEDAPEKAPTEAGRLEETNSIAGGNIVPNTVICKLKDVRDCRVAATSQRLSEPRSSEPTGVSMQTHD